MRLVEVLDFLNKIYPKMYSLTEEEVSKLSGVIKGFWEWLTLADRECATGPVSLPDSIRVQSITVPSGVYNLSAIQHSVEYLHDALYYLLEGEPCERLALYEDYVSGGNTLIDTAANALRYIMDVVKKSASVLNFVMRY